MITKAELQKKNKDKVEQLRAEIYYQSWGI
mgnify:CR=1 FL=1